jgi:hypothetical protein
MIEGAARGKNSNVMSAMKLSSVNPQSARTVPATFDAYRYVSLAKCTYSAISSRISGTTGHSHSMVLSHGNALIFRRNFFLQTVKARLSSRQNFSLLISEGNSRASNFPRLRQLSPAIGQFFTSSIAMRVLRRDKKRPSAPYSTIPRSPAIDRIPDLSHITIWTDRRCDRLCHRTAARPQTDLRSPPPRGAPRALPNAPSPRRGRSKGVASLEPEFRLQAWQ